ncbi:MAG: DUF4340 domain-containing protein [Clostridia bacterium]|nr:DUF4340 domain-containing protein [Clostridia bacterium]
MKSLKKLLVPIIILAVLIIATVIVFAVKNGSKDEVDNGPYQILKVNASDLVSFRVDRKGKEPLSIIPLTNDEGERYYILEGDSTDEASYSQDSFNSFLLVLLDFNADTKIDSSNVNLADYGLADPECKITVSTASGVRTVIIGNDTVSGGKCYVMVDNDTNIYTIPTAKKSFCLYDDLKFYQSISLGIDYDDVSKITIERTRDNLKLECVPEEYDETGANLFNITSPVNAKAGAYLTRLLNDLGGLEIAAFTTLSDEELEEYNILNPGYHFSFEKTNGEVVDLYLSELHNGVFYGYGSFTNDYFMISSQQINYIDSPIMDLIYPYVCYFSVTDVKKITCTLEDGYEFEFTFETKDSISSSDAKVHLDGRDAKIFSSSGRCYAAILFEAFACVDIGGIELEATPTLSNPVLSYKVHYNDYTSKVISFVPRDSSSYYCFINDEYSGYYVYARELFNDGGTDTYAYGIVPAYDLANLAIDNDLNGIYDIETGD